MTQPEELDLQRLLLIAAGHSAFQLLWAGVQLNVFDYLSQSSGSTLEQIADASGLRAYPCRVLMVGLTALGLIKRREGKFFNARLTEQMLVKGKPGTAAPILGWQAEIVYPGMLDFVESLRESRNVGLQRFSGTGNTIYERLASNPALERTFHDAMSALSAQANAHLLGVPDFGRFSRIVDAGGGDATNAIALVRKFPDLTVVVFDAPSVCSMAQNNIQAHGLADRISVWPGNFLIDPFPPDVDAVLYCHIFTIWSLERGRELLRRTNTALPVGGSVLLFNMMGDDDDSGPLGTALGSPYFLAIATGEGMLHAWKDYENILTDAGFSHVRRIENLPLNHGLIIGTK